MLGRPLFLGVQRRFMSKMNLDLIVTPAAARRISALKTEDGAATRLRLGVDGGGCSGFQYSFTTEAASAELGEDDIVFDRDGHTVVVDETSLDFVRGGTVDYQEEMIRSAFVVINNPNSESACGCGSSFALKNFDANPAID